MLALDFINTVAFAGLVLFVGHAVRRIAPVLSRYNVPAPVIGGLRARQFGVPVACVIIFVIAWLTARWMGATTRRQQFTIGAFWVVLTLVFEFVLGRAMGMSWSRMLSDYNPAHGGFMLLGLAFMFITPWLTRKLR